MARRLALVVVLPDAGLEAEVGGRRRCLLACGTDFWSDRRRAPIDADGDDEDFIVPVGRLPIAKGSSQATKEQPLLLDWGFVVRLRLQNKKF